MQLTRTLALAAIVCAALPALALQPPAQRDLHDFEFHHPELWWSSVYQPINELPREWSDSVMTDLDVLGVHHERAFLDRRTGRWGTLILTRPMIPGTGVGNGLDWSDFDEPAPRDHYQLMDAAGSAFLRFLAEHELELGFAEEEMTAPRMQVHGDDRIQMYIGREVDGIPVQDSYITANINSGNLILMGQRNWADLDLETRPSLNPEDAVGVLSTHLRGRQPTTYRQSPQLRIIPVSDQPDHTRVTSLGQGLDYRLVWVLAPVFRGDIGTWEAQVDAHSGELLSFEDTNHYHDQAGEAHSHSDHSHATTQSGGPSRGVAGGIFPVSNDGTPPDGVELPGYPMPFADVSLDGSAQGFTTTGGNAPSGGAQGTISTSLSGQYVGINSQCGSLNVSSDTGDLDLGDGAATDCAVPAGTSPGNTNAARTVFYGVGRINEQARGYLPTNNWLNAPINGVTNTSQTCNASWSTVTNTATFFNSGGGCGNTGEIMAVVHHEWGHGMDANSVNPGISRPGEGIADIYAQNMLNDSCVGRGFRPGQNCGGFGDPCLECTGVRESDWAMQQSGEPHDIAWIQAACPTGSGTPCGRSTHCEGSIVAETLWDLVHRDLQGFEGSVFDYDVNTALELGTRLTYEGAGAVGDWYQCTTTNGGCNADSGYLQYLAADADNGSIEDGTPHMSAIFAAFDRHQLACSTPTVQDSGCDNGPETAPVNVTATTFNEGVQLSWDPVDEATEYWVYRTEGPMGCEFGKARVGQVSETSFTETGLRNQFEVNYSVVAVGENSSCTSPMSGCVGVTPDMGPSGTIEGTVVRGGTGDALEGVLVEAIGDEITFSANTDAGGHFSIMALEGDYDVVAVKEGYQTAVVDDVTLDEGETVTVDLVLDAPQVDAWPPLVEMTVQQGESTQSSLAIDNVGTLDLEWSLTSDDIVLGVMPLDSHEPERDEPLGLSDFTLPGSGNHDETLIAGIESRGQVIGFTFEGTVSGISGTATWASDLAMTITGPDGNSYSVGGYQSGNPPWDFDGSGSDGNGTYTSTHIGADIFGEDGALDEGDWSFAFQHTWNDTMNWSDVTVTLHKVAPPVCQDPTEVDWLSTAPDAGVVSAGGSESVSVQVDATTLSAGEHEASLCLLSNDPGNPLMVIPVNVEVSEGPVDPPTIDVDPLALAFELSQNETGSDSLVVANLGDQGLEWSIDDTDSCELPGWVSFSSMSGTVGGGQAAMLEVNIDAGGLAVDDYTATLCIESNDAAEPLVEVELNLSVSEGPAMISGTIVSLGYCGTNAQPGAGAEVVVEGQDEVQFSAIADGDGVYQVQVPVEDGPVDVFVYLDDHIDGAELELELTAGEFVELDMELVLAAPCASASPSEFEFTLAGESASDVLVIGNLEGGGVLEWSLTGGAGCYDASVDTWLELSSNGDIIGGFSSQDVGVSVDSADLAPGLYETSLCIETNDAEVSSFAVPVALEAEAFAATIEGTITSLGYCSEDPAPAAAAEVLIEGQAESWTVVADAEGFYQIDVPANESPFDVTASAEGHLPESESGVSLEAGDELQADFDLMLDASCAVIETDALEATVMVGENNDFQLVISNVDGGSELSWSITVADEADGCEMPSQLAWLTVDPAEGSTAGGESSTVSVLAESAGLDDGGYGAWLCLTTDDDQNANIDVALMLEVLGIDLFHDRFEEATTD